ncbi:MAG: RNA polymerase subunit sigma-70, partial [Roseburia sp.]|nr:RNA polymerase subunit sigma-70 [Roseburia sp.]
AESRVLFVRRYWYMDSIADIAGRFGFSESRVKSNLFRTRNKLRMRLVQEQFL